MTIPSLRKSNIAKFVPMMSNDEVIKQLLTPPTSNKEQTPDELSSKLFSKSNLESIKDIDPASFNKPAVQTKLNDIVSSILVSTFHSLSVDINFTHKILEYICQEVRQELENNAVAVGLTDKTKKVDKVKLEKLQLVILDQIGEYVKVVHEDYKISLNKKSQRSALLSETNFCIKKHHELKEEDQSFSVTTINAKGASVTKTKKLKVFNHKSQFGLLGYQLKRKNSKISLDPKIKKQNNGNFKKTRDKIFNTSEIVNYKLKDMSDGSDSDIGEFLNRVGRDNKLVLNDECCSLSFIMMNNPKMRVGTKNSLELSTFLNSLSTIELSKCLPFLDVKFILPSTIETKSQQVFQTSSITQFLDGTPISRSDNLTTSIYKTLSANFVRDPTGDRPQRAVETNLSAFTMPQTVNNFDELYVGHFSSYAKGIKGNSLKHNLFKRNNTVHDYTKPFLTIKSFNIDVAPTQGLMSFKTGRLSLVLHDKARMSEIAPFIKPDLFGSFGAEIAIQYGWSHMDFIKNPASTQKVNYFAQFLDENKVYEKYIITNSSYTIDKNGQVNIDLAIAMKGPVSIRAINFESDTPQKIDQSYLDGKKTRIEDKETSFNEKMSTSLTKIKGLNPPGYFTSKARSIVTEFATSTDNEKGGFDVATKINDNKKKHRKKIKAALKGTKNSNKKKTASIPGKPPSGSPLKKLAAIGAAFEDIKNHKLKIMFTPSVGTDLTLPLSRATDANFKLVKGESIQEYVREIEGLYNALTGMASAAISKISKSKKEQSAEIEGLLQKITDGLSIEDPFFDLENFHNVEQLAHPSLTSGSVEVAKPNYGDPQRNVSEKIITFPTSIRGIDSYEGGAHASLTNYVSLGNIILAVLGSHLAFTRGYDEIQIVSYTLNSHAGLAMNKNVASLLINKTELTSLLTDLFKNGAQYTLESLLTQIIKKFITTRYCVNYGMKDFYKLNKDNQVVVSDSKKKPDEIKQMIDSRLEAIHALMYKGADDASFLQEIKFIMPKVKLLFDTVTTKESEGNDTILRISLFDRNDNPFNAISSIMSKVYEKGIHEAVRDINKRLIELKSLKKKDKDYSKHKKEFNENNIKLIKKLIAADFLELVDGEYIIKSSQANGFTTIKDQLKAFMPSINYGSNNSAIIDASISTINEAKLNTVYMTRPDRNDVGIKTRVRYKQDLPLRILPSQASITMFGCPFVNFAQYLFLDFETNTTIDNQYAVTGIKHEITPGKFTTNLTLAYGDAFGKYETVVDTLSRTVNEEHLKTKKKNSRPQNQLQDVYKFEHGHSKNNMNLLKIDQIDKNIELITVHHIKGDDASQGPTQHEDAMYVEQIEYKNLSLELRIKDIRIINIQEKFQAFYNINAYDEIINKDKDRKTSVIEFDKLVLALPDDLKNTKKYMYIDIDEKVINADHNYSWLGHDDNEKKKKRHDFFKNALKENNKTVIGKKSNPSGFIELIFNNNIELFEIAIEIYLIPMIEILIKPVNNYNKLDNESLLIKFKSYNDSIEGVKEKSRISYENKLLGKINRNILIHEGKKYKYSVELISASVDNAGLNIVAQLTDKNKNVYTRVIKVKEAVEKYIDRFKLKIKFSNKESVIR
jgi:hypothetical protein